MSLFTEILKHLVTGSVPVTLGTSGDVFDSITFMGFRADGTTANTSTVTVSPITPISGVSAVTVLSGATTTLIAPVGTTLTAAQFQVDSATALDGVVANYFTESGVDWNEIERKVEEAGELLIRTIPSLTQECTITRGLDSDTKGENTITCVCSSAAIRPIAQRPVGNYDCKLKAVIRSQCDLNTSRTQAQQLTKHWNRLARVRDVFLDETAISLLSNSVASFYVFDSIREVSCTTSIDDRSYVSEVEFTVFAIGSDIT